MAEINKVLVKINGQEYTIAGEMPREHILKVADYVNRKMEEIARGLPSHAMSSLAVLAAVNAADEYYKQEDESEALRVKCSQLEKDAEHYVQLWDEAKKSFLEYKEDAQSSLEHMDELQKQFNDKTEELTSLSGGYEEMEARCSELEKKNQELLQRLSAQEDADVLSTTEVKELEAKCKDIENSFFDLQMENIQLKGELDRYKKIVEETA